MICELITVGTEILLGNIVDTHSQYLSDKLAGYGINVYHHNSVGDNKARVMDCFKTALDRSDMVILSGGLGPTTDDITLECVCEVLGLECYYNEQALSEIERHFTRLNRVMQDNNKKQAFVPYGSTLFLNKHGTAPGVMIDYHGKKVVILPGPPRELRPMFTEYLTPILEDMTNQTLNSKTLHVYGVGESSVETMIGDIVRQENPTVALYAKDYEVHIRVTELACKTNGEDRLVKTDETIEKLIKILGDSVYTTEDQPLEQVVVDLLKQKGLKLAVAESCTGGTLAGRITAVSGSSSVFDCGVVSYSNEIKQKVLGVSADTLKKHGAVSDEVAKEMAVGVLRLSGSDIGVSVTGIAGPDGGTKDKPVGTVHIGVATKDGVTARKFLFGYNRINERELIRTHSVMRALNEVRLLVMGQEK